MCDGHKCGCARARTRLLCARAHVWDTGVGARASTGCARAGTSERVGVGGWGCGWGERGCVGGRAGVCVARECEGVRACVSACVCVCVCVCACGRVCAGGCVGVCPCSEALFLEDRKISEKKSSSGTLAGTLLKQRYSAEQRYSVGKGSSRGTRGTLLGTVEKP